MQLQISKKDVKVVDGFYPSRYTKEEYRHGIMSLQDKMMSMPDAILEDSEEYPLRHTFADKQYIREVQFPKGHLIVTKIHNVQHPFFLMSGEISFLTEKGETRISAPYYGITDVGTKRVIYVHEDCSFITVHPTTLKNVEDIEKEVIAETYNKKEVI